VLTPSELSDLTDCIETANLPQTKLENLMTNTNTANTDTNTAVLGTLELQGADIARQWKSINKVDKARFSEHTKADGFDMRLGKLMVALSVECEGRIKSTRLADCGINIVDKRRRSEAKWFVENEVEAREFIAKSKKGYTSLSALQKAMSKADKQASSTDDTASTKDKPKADASPKTSEAKLLTKDEVFKQILEMCNQNDVETYDIAQMLVDMHTDAEHAVREAKRHSQQRVTSSNGVTLAKAI
jgi:hypothetical protein